MKRRLYFVAATIGGLCAAVFAQSTFSIEEYQQFLEANENLGSAELLARHAPAEAYYSRIEGQYGVGEFSYLDTIMDKYELTEGEQALLQSNHFVVSERLSYHCFGAALFDIYHKDLPLLVTTDAILHALHASYDNLLIEMELSILKPSLAEVLNGLHGTFPQLLDSYASSPELQDALRDVDLYVTVAKSLLEETKLAPQYTSAAQVDSVWEAILAEDMACMPLFTDVARKLDFSQFILRGHYTQEPELASYFKSMMWLGRVDFILADPPVEWYLTRDGLRRMNLGAILLNELVDKAGVRSTLEEMDAIIEFMVGESDNLTPAELADLVVVQGLTGADDLLDEGTFDAFLGALKASPAYGQKILSMLIRGSDTPGSDPVALPVSFRLLGQRFIIDSYIFSNVVYDRIVYEGQKVLRMMPDPLDAMFALGNDDALPLLAEELERYPYAAQLTSLRYLVDAYDEEFWDLSLYNVWLQAIRELNPSEPVENFPLFMKTAAWHQEKLNTQLASWSQLRHDNLLYAKQSYTGMAVCSFPHSYVEPYPAFYRRIASFADKAGAYFAEVTTDTSITAYFSFLRQVMTKLEVLAQKELDGLPFSSEEVDWLKGMLFYEYQGCVDVPKGWYTDLYYGEPEDPAGVDFITADVHTQPTDEAGNIVGRILHVGVGRINLGVFLAASPSADYQPMAYVGPVMSYYEKVTEQFDRLTDERWAELVWADDLPARPDWVNSYLADSEGAAMVLGRELPGIPYTRLDTKEPGEVPEAFSLAQNYPNPFNPSTTIHFDLPAASYVVLTVSDLLGREVVRLVEGMVPAGGHHATWHGKDMAGREVPAGIYIARLVGPGYSKSIKMVLLK